MLSIPRLVLHTGLHKTGTTTLQVALEALRPQLRLRGVALITIGQMKRLSSDGRWAAYRKGDDASPEFAAEFRGLVGEEMDAVRAASGDRASQVLVTSERMLGARMPSEVDYPVFRPLADRAIDQIVSILDPGEVHVALYTRRQDRLMESCYLWEVQKGLSHPIEQQFPFRFEPVMGYSRLIDRIVTRDRVRSIRVRPFETIAAGSLAYLDDFLGNVGLSGALDLTLFGDEPSANRSYSAFALEMALQVNPHLVSDEQRLAVRRFLTGQFPAGEYPAAQILSHADRERIVGVYRADNERTFSTWMPELPFDAYSTLEGVRALGNTLLPVVRGGAGESAHP